MADSAAIVGACVNAAQRALGRLLSPDPYADSYLLHQVTLGAETKSEFPDWTGDLLGRWLLAVAKAKSIGLAGAEGIDVGRLLKLAETVRKFQRSDGHVGPTEQPKSWDRTMVYGQGWLILGLLEVGALTGESWCIDTAVGIGSYFLNSWEDWRQEVLHPSSENYPYYMDLGTLFHNIHPLVELQKTTGNPAFLSLVDVMAQHALSLESSDHTHHYLQALRGRVALAQVQERSLNGLEDEIGRFRAVGLELGEVPSERIYHHERDEACAIADWLLLHLEVGAMEKAMEIAEVGLLPAQFPSGGFGHRKFAGAPIMGAEFDEEAPWCCCMHGTVALCEMIRVLQIS